RPLCQGLLVESMTVSRQLRQRSLLRHRSGVVLNSRGFLQGGGTFRLVFGGELLGRARQSESLVGLPCAAYLFRRRCHFFLLQTLCQLLRGGVSCLALLCLGVDRHPFLHLLGQRLDVFIRMGAHGIVFLEEDGVCRS